MRFDGFNENGERDEENEEIEEGNGIETGVLVEECPDATDGIGAYLKEVRRLPLLLKEEEYALARAFRFWTQRAKRISRKIKQERGKREKRNLDKTLKECERKAHTAKHKLAEHNLRLVVHVAKQYFGLTLMDRIQEGNIGLMRAIEKFDHRKGCAFSTYAVWWIRQIIMRAIDDKERLIRIPVHRLELMRQCARAKEKLRKKNERDPSQGEMAEAISISEEEMLFLIESDKTPLSLNAPMGEEKICEMQDFLEDALHFNPEQTAIIRQELTSAQQEINARAACLSDKEKYILWMRIVGKQTLREVGGKLHLTRERVRQIEKNIIEKLFGKREKMKEEIEPFHLLEELAEELT